MLLVPWQPYKAPADESNPAHKTPGEYIYIHMSSICTSYEVSSQHIHLSDVPAQCFWLVWTNQNIWCNTVQFLTQKKGDATNTKSARKLVSSKIESTHYQRACSVCLRIQDTWLWTGLVRPRPKSMFTYRPNMGCLTIDETEAFD